MTTNLLPEIVVNSSMMETIIEMSRAIQFVLDHADEYSVADNETDSRAFITLVPVWAAEFEEAHRNDGWITSDDPHKKYLDGYYDLIDDFVIEKMQQLYGKPDPNKSIEWCPNCNSEVDLDAVLKAQMCPNCKVNLLPCHFCMDTVLYRKRPMQQRNSLTLFCTTCKTTASLC